MRILQPKNASSEGAKNHEVEKVIESKNDRNKSCPKFCKLVDEVSKMWLLQLKNNILIMYIMYIKNHAFLALEPQKIKILQKHFTGIIFSPIEMI